MPDSTPKPISLVTGHRTKAEKEQREKAEKAMMTGYDFKEWTEVKTDPIAHKQFVRLKRLYKSIGRDDAMIETVINRYCKILSECEKYEKEVGRLRGIESEVEKRSSEMEFAEYIKTILEINKQIQANDKLLQLKRKMLLDIEKENVMTLVSAMRSIPKKADNKPNPLKEALMNGG